MKNFKSNSNSNSTNTQNLNNQIETIYRMLATQASDNSKVKKEKPKRGSSCKSIISIFDSSREDARLCQSYAFYSSTYFPDKLGSVAIYGDNVSQLYGQLKKTGYLFGHRIRGIKVEMGRRPFIDVTLKV